MDIAKYYATLGIRVNRKEISKVDAELSRLEHKLKSIKPLKIRISASSISVDKDKLTRTLGAALDAVSNRVSFEITRFVVNDRALMAALLRAMRRLPPLPPSGDPRPPPRRDRDRDYDRGRRDRDRSSIWAGGAAGIASRLYAPAIAIAGGAYGLSWLNRKNQEIVSTELGANAVLGKDGPQDISWLKAQANKVGFNWLEAAPEFTGFMGAASPLMGHQKSLDTFQAFNEFATTRHSPAIARKRALMALKQMASKGTVMSEELFLQLGEAQGFTELPMMFAEALQQKTGGNLKGAAAAKFLKEQMKLGKVKTGDILPLVTQMMSAKAAPTLAMSSKSSMAEQARYQNAVNEQVTNANKSGVESGYARLFRAFTAAMIESTPAVEGLAKGFDTLSKYVSFAVLLPQSITRAFEGRDSWVADAMGAANVAILKDLVTGLGELGSELKKTFGVVIKGWKLIFDEFGDEMLKFLGGMKNFFLYTMKAINSIVTGDMTGATNASNAIRATLAGKSQEDIEKIAAGGPAPTLVETVTGAGSYLQYTPPGLMYKAVKGVYGYADDALGVSDKINLFAKQLDYLNNMSNSDYGLGPSVPLSPYETTADRYDQNRLRALQAADDSKRFQQQAADSAKLNTTGVMPLPAISKQTLEVIIKAEDIKGADHNSLAAKISDGVKTYVETMFTHAMIANPTKE